MISSSGRQFPRESFHRPRAGPASSFGVLQPFLKQGPGDLGELDLIGRSQLRPFEVVGKDLIVEIEIPFALDQDGAGGRVEIVEGTDKPQVEALLQPQEGGGGDRDPQLLQKIEKFREHDPSHDASGVGSEPHPRHGVPGIGIDPDSS